MKSKNNYRKIMEHSRFSWNRSAPTKRQGCILIITKETAPKDSSSIDVVLFVTSGWPLQSRVAFTPNCAYSVPDFPSRTVHLRTTQS